MQAKDLTGYTLSYEYCGYATKMYVVRRYGAWVATASLKETAIAIIEQHINARSK